MTGKRRGIEKRYVVLKNGKKNHTTARMSIKSLKKFLTKVMFIASIASTV